MAAPVFIILTPAFAAFEGDAWIPGLESMVRSINTQNPNLKVLILTFHFPETNGSEYEWYGNRVIAFSGAHRKGKIRSLMRWKKVWAALDQIRSQQSILGILSIFCSECAFVGHYYARRHGLKHKIWVMGQDARKSNNQVRRIRPRPEELVCISDFLVSEFERNHGICPAQMIPIGIEESQPIDGGVRDIDVLCVGSLIPLKQFDWLVELVEFMLPMHPELKAVLIGEGPERKHLDNLIHQKNLQHHIRLTGRIPHQEVLSMMQRSRLLFHPSSYEGLGLVCLEALSAGAEVLGRCKPFDQEIPHWYFGDSLEEMKVKAAELLLTRQDQFSLIPFKASEAARRILECFA